MGSDGFPLVAYYADDSNDPHLRIAKCGDAACSGPTTITPIEGVGVGDVGSHVSVPRPGRVNG